MNLGPATLLSVLILFHAKRKRSLSNSGCIGAVIVGLITFLNSQLLTTLILLTFFFSSSWLTKFKSSTKKGFEEGIKENGQRTITQVMCNSLTGSVFAILYQINVSYAPSSRDYCLTSGDWPSFFMLCFIGHYACCCADTWASELGILNSDWPYLITNLKQVPPGTNGAISFLGTLVSLMGGQVIGLVASLTLQYQHPDCGLRLGLMGLGMLAGLFGSLLDSFLGATVQATYFNKTTKKIIHGTPKNNDEKSKEVKIVWLSGRNYLDNNMVNFISSLITALITGIIGNWLLYVA